MKSEPVAVDCDGGVRPHSSVKLFLSFSLLLLLQERDVNLIDHIQMRL